MKRIRSGVSIVFILTAGLALAASVAAGEQREWNFTALLDGKDIGYQTFQLTEKGEERVLISEAQYKVKLLFVTVYSYKHHDKEVWHGDCLRRIDSRTDDNGEDYFVRGELEPSKFVVESADGHQQLPGCVMTFAYWNPDILQADRLLNSETGEYMNVEVVDHGPETIRAKGREHEAKRYELVTDKFTIDLWYSPQQEWLGLETITESGRRLRYLLK